jgi:hypothetical protein
MWKGCTTPVSRDRKKIFNTNRGKPMILHTVLLPLPPDHDAGEATSVMQALAALVGRIDGFTAFAHGPNIDAEGRTPGHPYGFVCTFADRAALDRYAADPRHLALGARLVALCGGAEGILVSDIDTGQDI